MAGHEDNASSRRAAAAAPTGASRRRFIPLVFGVALFAGATAIWARGLGSGVALGKPAAPIRGENWDGAGFSLDGLRGKAVLLFFGYTSCPDICPGSLAKARRVYNRLAPAHKQRLAVVFVSVDPERDTLERLASYVPAFDASFLGVRVAPEAFAGVLDGYDAVAEKRASETGDGFYVMDHTSSFFLLDAAGVLVETLPVGIHSDVLRERLLPHVEQAARAASRS